MAHGVGFYVLDRFGEPLGLVDEPVKFNATIRWMDIGAFSVQFRAEDPVAETVGRGVRAAVLLDGDVFVSGPVQETIRTGDEIGELVELAGPDDLTWLNWRNAMPSAPSYAPNLAVSFDLTASVEDVIYGYVNPNLGPASLDARRAVRSAPSLHRGSSASESARFDKVLDVAQRNAIIEGFGLRCRWDRAVRGLPLFEVVESRDLRTQVRFSPDRQTLSKFTSTDTGPGATHVLVGGAGAGTGRIFGAVDDDASAAEWWRVETFVDAGNVNDLPTLIQRAEDARQQGGLTMELEAIETEGLVYGGANGWQLGDIVAGDDGHVETAFVIVQVQLSGPEPFRITPLLAQFAGWRAGQLAQVRQRQADLRLRSLETRS